MPLLLPTPPVMNGTRNLSKVGEYRIGDPTEYEEADESYRTDLETYFNLD